MKKYTHIIIIIVCAVLGAGCKDKIGPEDCFMSAGKDSHIEIRPGSFFEIEASDRFVVVLKQDTTQSNRVIIRGGGNVIKNVSVSVSNNKLTLKDRNVCNWTRDYSKKITVEIYFRTLHGITVKDAAEVKNIDTLVSDSLVIFHRGPNNINLNVKVGKLEVNHESTGTITINGYAAIFVPVLFSAGKLDASRLQGDYTFAYHYGINTLQVFPYKVLFVLVGNKGNTFYYSVPIEQPLSVTRFGSGLVEKR